jgi:hypothetical protein
MKILVAIIVLIAIQLLQLALLIPPDIDRSKTDISEGNFRQ